MGGWEQAGRAGQAGFTAAASKLLLDCLMQTACPHPPGPHTLRLLVWYRSALPASRVANSDLSPPSPLQHQAWAAGTLGITHRNSSPVLPASAGQPPAARMITRPRLCTPEEAAHVVSKPQCHPGIHNRHKSSAPEEAAHIVSVLAVPLGPDVPVGPGAHHVGADVPGLADQLDLGRRSGKGWEE